MTKKRRVARLKSRKSLRIKKKLAKRRSRKQRPRPNQNESKSKNFFVINIILIITFLVSIFNIFKVQKIFCYGQDSGSELLCTDIENKLKNKNMMTVDPQSFVFWENFLLQNDQFYLPSRIIKILPNQIDIYFKKIDLAYLLHFQNQDYIIDQDGQILPQTKTNLDLIEVELQDGGLNQILPQSGQNSEQILNKTTLSGRDLDQDVHLFLLDVISNLKQLGQKNFKIILKADKTLVIQLDKSADLQLDQEISQLGIIMDLTQSFEKQFKKLTLILSEFESIYRVLIAEQSQIKDQTVSLDEAETNSEALSPIIDLRFKYPIMKANQ